MKRNMRMVGGKVMMDRNAPQGLLDTPQMGYDETRQVISDWHGKGRNHVAITPRFAITSTPEQMEATQALAREFPDLHIQTHLSENHDEINSPASFTLKPLITRIFTPATACSATGRCSATPSTSPNARPTR
jgi:cytosine/adenosine deaminase-related metal-dependent hydrolase